MEKLLKQAQELNAALQAELKSLKVATAEANNTAANARAFKVKLEGELKEIELREAAIVEIESVQAMLNEVKKERAAFVDENTAFQKDKSIFSGQVAKFNLAAQEMKRDQDLCKKDWALLKEAQDQLNEDRKNYRDEILNNLKASVK